MTDEQKSLTWVSAWVMIGILVFGWGSLAGSYAGAHSPKRGDISENESDDVDTRIQRDYDSNSVAELAVNVFLQNALDQLPNFSAVISWHMTNRIWLPIVIVVLEIAALVGACSLKKVERALEEPRQRLR
jgi:hypothetical protein